MKAAVATAAWLGAGITIAGGLYWAFLNTPESNVAMLAVSTLLVVAIAAVAGITVNGAVLAARAGGAPTRTVMRAVGSLPAFAVSAAVMLAVWWLATTGAAWTASHSGEISAWFIATAGWADVRWLFTAAAWGFAWMAWVAGPALGLSLLASRIAPGPADRGLHWLTRVAHWRVIGLATVWFALLVWLPWQAAPGRPAVFPTGGVEPVLAALKLAAIGVVMTLGLALVIRAAAGRTPDRTV